MNNKNELLILNIIKYGPLAFILSLSIITTFTLYLSYKSAFIEEKELIEKKFTQNNRLEIKKQIESIYNYIKEKQKDTEESLKESLQKRVYEAHSIAMNIYNENKHLGQKKVTKMIKDALRNIRFNNGRGYFFIYSFDYECILLPVAKKLEGTSFYNFRDGDGAYVVRKSINQLKKKKETSLKWSYHKPDDMKKQYKKIGFNKKFEPYNWYIGTGEYIEDFKRDVKKEVLEFVETQQYHFNNYIFIFDHNANYIAHKDPQIIGKKADDTIKNIVDIAKEKDSTYLQYTHIRPQTNKEAKKTSYLRNINDWQWVIGVGFYEEDVKKSILAQKKILDKRFKDDIYKILLICLGLTGVLLLLSAKISKFLESRFSIYRNQIKDHLEEITNQQNILAQQSKMAAIGTMIGNIAHQWRQPLSLISTAATGMKLKKEFNNLTDKEFYENLDYINQSTQYLSKTIDDFRNFFASNKTKKEFKINEAFENSFNLIDVQFKNHDIQVIKDISNSEIYGIQTELVQVIINILNNSRDELIKTNTQEDKIIFIKTYEKNNFLIIEILDNAGGIKEEIIEHVFEPYFTTKDQSQGTGIGLYMSQEIITKHMHGEIKIENENYVYKNKNYTGVKTTIKLNLSK